MYAMSRLDLTLLLNMLVVVLIVYLLRVQPVVDFSDVLAASIVADLVLDIVPIFIPAAVESGGTGV